MTTIQKQIKRLEMDLIQVHHFLQLAENQNNIKSVNFYQTERHNTLIILEDLSIAEIIISSN